MYVALGVIHSEKGAGKGSKQFTTRYEQLQSWVGHAVLAFQDACVLL